MMSCDMLKQQLRQQLLSARQIHYVVPHDFHVAWRLHYTITVKHIDAAIGTLLL